jgi:cardiolipin synthase A/B
VDFIQSAWQEIWRSLDARQITLFYLLVEAGAIAAAIESILKTRTAQGAIAWAIGLVMMPMLVLPIYLVFGRRKFFGYRRSRIRGKHKVQLEAARAFKLLQPFLAVPSPYPVLEKIVQMPATIGNRVELLVNGVNAFPRMFAAIDAATQYVLLQFYIVRDDELGKELQRRLIDKAQQGVAIYFLYDEIGSLKLGSDYIDELREAGVRIFAFNSTKGWRNRFQLNFRNHRKLLVVDGTVAFVGGMNIGDEYVDRDDELTPWRDTQIQLEGPAVACLQIAFMEDWHWATDAVPQFQWRVEAAARPGLPVLIALSGPADAMETCELVFLELINSASKRLWIVSPYFVPELSIINALTLAALRGADVRIMLPQNPDHLLVYLSSYSYLREALLSGIGFYRYHEGFLHQKVLLVDDHTASVGSANLDNRSFRLNFEMNAVVHDYQFAHEVAAMLEADFEHCHVVSLHHFSARPWWFRFAVRCARLLAPIQ